MISGIKAAFGAIILIIETIALTIFNVMNVVIYSLIAIVIIGLIVFGLSLRERKEIKDSKGE